jgi:hypothetical protein
MSDWLLVRLIYFTTQHFDERGTGTTNKPSSKETILVLTAYIRKISYLKVTIFTDVTPRSLLQICRCFGARRQMSIRLHGVTHQDIILFIITSMRTTNRINILFNFCYNHRPRRNLIYGDLHTHC